MLYLFIVKSAISDAETGDEFTIFRMFKNQVKCKTSISSPQYKFNLFGSNTCEIFLALNKKYRFS